MTLPSSPCIPSTSTVRCSNSSRRRSVVIFTVILFYIIILWLFLFVVLPCGVRPLDAPEPGDDPVAPQAPRMWTKALVTTVIAALLWVGVDIFILSDVFSFRDP